ncbi:MAG: hypothetical protein P4L33_10420 [Capsulimonadaceae bacterium]|nr:hypothetical protein [Capsulimonadaceae bacterium]
MDDGRRYFGRCSLGAAAIQLILAMALTSVAAFGDGPIARPMAQLPDKPGASAVISQSISPLSTTRVPVPVVDRRALTAGKNVVRALALSPAQRSQFRAVSEWFKGLRQSYKNDPTLTPLQKRAALKGVNDQERQALQTLLTPDQRDRLEQLRAAARLHP